MNEAAREPSCEGCGVRQREEGQSRVDRTKARCSPQSSQLIQTSLNCYWIFETPESWRGVCVCVRVYVVHVYM